MHPDITHKLQKENKNFTDYKINIQMVIFMVVAVIVILSLIYLIRIYANKKHMVMQEMQIEATRFETIIADNLNYARYFIGLIGKSIKQDAKNLQYIEDKLKNHFHSKDFNMLFGWRKYSWIDNNFQEIVTSTSGVIKKPRDINFVRDRFIPMHIENKIKDQIIFYFNKSINKSDTLKLIDYIFDENQQEFIGAVVLSYDIDTIVANLNNNRKNTNINYIIVNKNLDIIAKSRSVIDKIIYEDNNLSEKLNHLLTQIAFENEHNQDISYLDMTSGVNYLIKSLDNLPFAVIVNIDNNFIKNNIVETITVKMIEVGIFMIFSLIIIISIYKRETSLRAKAEKATMTANNATKAKTNFLAFTAHEIRSPLGFILTGSEAMLQELFGPVPKHYKEYAEGIYNNSQIIIDFINDILDEDQIIAGHFKIMNATNKIEPIIKKIVSLNKKEKNVSIITNFAPNLPMLICDKRRISQVIENLISNSIKYSRDKVLINISVYLENRNMIFELVDNGIGMKDEEIPMAISKYGTLHNQDYHKGGSYGLGLTIVKTLLDSHDAKLEITNNRGNGITVKITFPRYKLVYNKLQKNQD